MYKIGLTGSIGSGKSTVSKLIEKRNIPLIDADDISRKMTADNSPIIDELKEAFGNEILRGDGTLDRRKVAAIAFSSEEGIKKLTTIVTNKVKSEMALISLDMEQSGEKLVVMDIPLLFENEMEDSFDEVWSVVADDELRFERAHARDGISREDFESRDKSQISQNIKVNKSDVVFQNSGTIEELEKAVSREINRIIFFSGWLNK